MSLGRLLAAGKSLIGMKDNTSPYRMNPENLLPKFGSAKNPFATANAPAPEAPKVTTAAMPVVAMAAPVPPMIPKAEPMKVVAQSLFEVKPAPVAPVMAAKDPVLLEPTNNERSAGTVEETPALGCWTVRASSGSDSSGSGTPVLAGVPMSGPSGGAAPTPSVAEQFTGGFKYLIALCNRAAGGASALVKNFGGSLKNFAMRAKAVKPLALLPARKSAAQPAKARPLRTPVQAELSLERVKVVRNDLSDADLEVVPVRPAATQLPLQPTKPVPPVLQRPTASATEPTAWNRLASRFFGAKETQSH